MLAVEIKKTARNIGLRLGLPSITGMGRGEVKFILLV